ncbi:helix-turn-helix transcriptional regulator [Streptomyces sp. NPDC002104]
MNTRATIIHAYRVRRGWTQRQLAERLAVSPAAVGHWESGRNKVSDGSWGAACYLLDVDVNDALKSCETDAQRRHVLIAYTTAFPELARIEKENAYDCR